MVTSIPFLLLVVSLFLLPQKAHGRYRELKTCGPGHELQNIGDGIQKCKRCQVGFFSDSHTTPCNPCTTCTHGVRKRCTRKRNTVCREKRGKKHHCTTFLILGRYKRFKKYCQDFYSLILQECQTEQNCWWLDRIRGNNANTIPKVTLTTTQKTTVTDIVNTSTESESTETSRETRPSVYHAAYISSEEPPVIFTVSKTDAQYEEAEPLGKGERTDSRWYLYTAVTACSLLVLTILLSFSFFFYKKIKANKPRQKANSSQVPRSVNAHHSSFTDDSQLNISPACVNDDTACPVLSTELEQESFMGGCQVSDPSATFAQDVCCNGQERVQGNTKVSFHRPVSAYDCQVISNVTNCPTSNTLPLTKKEREILFGAWRQCRSKQDSIWTVDSHTDVQKYLKRIFSRASLLGSSVRSVLYKTSEDEIYLCSDKDVSISLDSVSTISGINNETTHPSLEDMDSSLDLSIGNDSPYPSDRDLSSNDSDSVNMVCALGVENTRTEVFEAPCQAANSVTTLNNQVQNRHRERCSVTFTNNLRVDKPMDTRPENLFGNLFKSEGTQTQHNAESTRSIYGHPWSTSGHFTREGGKLTKPTSDIVLEIPQNAVPDGETVFVQGLFTVDFHGLQSQLCQDDVIVSPIAEFQMSHLERWAKFVRVVLPCVHGNQKETFRVRFYQRTKEGDIEHGDVPLYDPSLNQELYYVKRASHVEIFTIHFTGFYCSVCCHTLPLDLNVMVFGCYGIHDTEAWISLHIGDRRLELRDFRHDITEEEKKLWQTQLLAQEEIRLIDQSDGHSRLEFSLVIRKEPQAWEVIAGASKQIRRLQELVKCSCSSHVSGHVTRCPEVGTTHTCHHKLKWVYKPIGDTLPASFSFNVHVEHVLSSNNVTERHDECEEGITDIPVPPIYLPQRPHYSMPKPPLSQAGMAFPEIPSSRKPMFSRREDVV